MFDWLILLRVRLCSITEPNRTIGVWLGSITERSIRYAGHTNSAISLHVSLISEWPSRTSKLLRYPTTYLSEPIFLQKVDGKIAGKCVSDVFLLYKHFSPAVKLPDKHDKCLLLTALRNVDYEGLKYLLDWRKLFSFCGKPWGQLIQKKKEKEKEKERKRTEKKKKIVRWPGIEPGSTAWKAAMLTTIPPTLDLTIVEFFYYLKKF